MSANGSTERAVGARRHRPTPPTIDDRCKARPDFTVKRVAAGAGLIDARGSDLRPAGGVPPRFPRRDPPGRDVTVRQRGLAGVGMRRLAAALAALIAVAVAAPAGAGSTSASLAVRATVAAACAIDPRQPLSPSRGTICLPSTTQSTIRAPAPIVALTRNAGSDVSVLTVSF